MKPVTKTAFLVLFSLIAYFSTGTNHDVKATDWNVDVLIKEWLITPHDLAINGSEIYISGNLDDRIVVVDLQGQIQRYYTIDKIQGFDNVCVDVTSEGKVYAISSRGIWNLKSDGEAEKIANVPFDYLDHMTIGSNDVIYVSYKHIGGSAIATLDLNGTKSNIVFLNSNRISDLEFDSMGNLFMFDAEFGQILKYTQEAGLETLASGIYPAGGGPGYIGIQNDEIYFANEGEPFHLTFRNGESSFTPLDFEGGSDFVFLNDSLYIMDIYASMLYRVELDYNTVLSEKVLIDGLVPWEIDNQGNTIVGQRSIGSNNWFYTYLVNDTVSIKPNNILQDWSPDHYTFDDAGNAYLLKGDALAKVSVSGDVDYQIEFSGEYSWGPGIKYSPVDGNIYAYDEISNKVFKISKYGCEPFYTFSEGTERVLLAITPQGRIYASLVSMTGSKVVEITNSEKEILVWLPTNDVGNIQLDSDANGNLYSAMGAGYQWVYFFNVSDGNAYSMIPMTSSRHEYGFVDPQGFALTKSGDVILSTPGLLLRFNRLLHSSLSIDVSEKNVQLGNQINVSGIISPPGQSTEITLNYMDPEGLMIKKTVWSSSLNKYSDMFTPSKAGQWSVQATWEGDSTVSGSASQTVSFIIAEPEPDSKGGSGIPGFTFTSLIVGLSFYWIKRNK